MFRTRGHMREHFFDLCTKSFPFSLEWWLVLVWMIFSAASYAIVVAALIEVARMDVIDGWSTRPQTY